MTDRLLDRFLLQHAGLSPCPGRPGSGSLVILTTDLRLITQLTPAFADAQPPPLLEREGAGGEFGFRGHPEPEGPS